MNDSNKLQKKVNFFHNKLKCSSCNYENSQLSNYCVKCGKLLSGKKVQIVISFEEYQQLIKNSNMTIYEKIKKEIKKL